MSLHSKFKKAGLILVMGLTLSTAVLAAGPSQGNPSVQGQVQRQEQGQVQGLGLGRAGNNLLTLTAEQLDMSVLQLRLERQEGKSLLEIANQKGVSEEELTSAITAKKMATLVQQNSEGKISTEQLNYCKSNMLERTKEGLSRTTTGPRGEKNTRRGLGNRKGRSSGICRN